MDISSLLTFGSILSFSSLLIHRQRNPQKFYCITFDLDDTIWRCRPVIERAANTFMQYLHSNYPEIAKLYPTKTEWRTLSAQVAKEYPDKKYDLSLLRKLCLEKVAKEAGLNPIDVVEPAHKAFLDERNQVMDQLFPDALEVLKEIQVQGIQMGAISNGNAVVADISGLRDFFAFAVNPETAGAKKPSMLPFEQALKWSNANAPCEIIHIGDSITSDVQAAQKFGCRTVWIKSGSIWSGTAASLAGDKVNNGRGDVELNSLSELLPVLRRWKVLR